jgi:hypothetical protein
VGLAERRLYQSALSPVRLCLAADQAFADKMREAENGPGLSLR